MMDLWKTLGITTLAALHAGAAETQDKALRFHEMLLKRADNDVLFGRLLDAWLEQGDLAGLRTFLEERTTAANATAADWQVLATFRSFSGDEKGLLEALDAAVKADPADAGLRVARAKALGAALRFDEALADLAAAAKDPTRALEALTQRGRLLARAGRPEEAVKAWREAIAAHPDDQGLREDLIELEIGEGLLEQAATSARELADATSDPYQKALRRLRVAEILAQAGKRDDAAAEYRSLFDAAAEASWLEREILARTSILYSREDDLTGLKTFLEALRETHPRRIALKTELARLWFRLGSPDEGIALFREILPVLPGEREIREEFATLLEGSDRAKEAAMEIEALLRIEAHRGDIPLWERLAGIHRSLGDEKACDSALEECRRLDPPDEAGALAAAARYTRHERPERGEEILRAARDTHGPASAAAEALANHLATTGRADEALAEWKTMAANADREGLLRICRTMNAHGKQAEVSALLASRMDEVRADPLLLAAYCQSATFSDQPDSALPAALEWVRAAKSTSEFETALRQTTALVQRSENPQAFLDSLAALPNPGTRELCLLAELHESRQDSLAAEKALEQAVSGNEPLLAASQRVRLHEARGNLDAAIAATRAWLELPGGLKIEQIRRLVDLLERNDDRAGALAAIDRWKLLAPGDKQAWTRRATLLAADARPDEAVAELRRALARFGADDDLRTQLASILEEAGRIDEAWRMLLALYEEAENATEKIKWAGSLARLAALEGREAELLADFERRARDQAGSPVPLLAMAEMFRTWMNPAEEARVVAEASRRQPQDSSLLLRLADLAEAEGDAARAEEFLQRATRLQDKPDTRRRLSALLLRSGEIERGIRTWLAEESGGDPRETERMLQPLLDQNETETALRILATETQRHPQDWRLTCLLATTLEQADRTAEAFETWLGLFQAQTEIPGLSPLIHPQQMTWLNQINGMVRDASFFRQISQILENHAQNRARGYVNPAQPPLPGNLEELRHTALFHAVRIARTEADPAPWLARIPSPVLPISTVVSRLHGLDPKALHEWLISEKSTPADFEFHLANSRHSDTPPSDIVIRQIIDRGLAVSRQDHPHLALRLLLSRLYLPNSSGRLRIEILDDALELFERIPVEQRKQQWYFLPAVCFATKQDIPAETRHRARSLLLTMADEENPPFVRSWMLQTIACEELAAGQVEEAAAAFAQAREAAAQEAAKPAANRPHTPRFNPYSTGHWSFRSFNEPDLGFSSIFTPLLPDALSTRIRMNLPASDSSGNNGLDDETARLARILDASASSGASSEITPIPAEAARAILPKLEEPHLRIALLLHLKDDDAVQKEIDALAQAETPTAENLRLAASYHFSVRKQAAKAYPLLVRASRTGNHPAEIRTRYDREILLVGLEVLAQTAEGETPPAIDEARHAALRLRPSFASREDQRASHAATLAKLGLEAEAERFRSSPPPRVLASRGFSSGMRSMTSRSSPRGNLLQEITRLLQENRREDAARKYLAHLRQLLNQPHADYETNRAIESLQSLQLTSDLLDLAAPAPTASVKARTEFANLAIRLGEGPRALTILRELIAAKPDDATLQTLLLGALPAEEQREQVAALLATPDPDTEAIGTWFMHVILGENRRSSDFAAYQAALELLCHIVESLPPSGKATRNLSFVNYAAVNQANNNHFDSLQLRPLDNPDRKNDSIDEEKSAARAQLVLRLFRAMLRHPQTSTQGFMLLSGYARGLGLDAEALHQDALTALATSLLWENSPNDRSSSFSNNDHNLWGWRRGNGSTSSSGAPAGALHPSAYLVTSRKALALEQIMPEGIAETMRETKPEEAAAWEIRRKILASPGTAALDAWWTALENPEQPPAEALLQLTHNARLIGRTDLTDALSSRISTLPWSTGDGSPNGHIRCLPVLLAASKDAATREKRLHDFTSHILGPQEGWPLFKSPSGGRIDMRIYHRFNAYSQFVRDAATEEALLVPVHRFLIRENMRFQEAFNSTSVRGITSATPAAEAVAILRASGLLEPGFEPAVKTSDGSSLIESAAKRLAQSREKEATQELSKALLAVKGPQSFWAHLLAAQLAKDSQQAAKTLADSHSALGKWPARATRDFHATLTTWFPDLDEKAKPATRRLLASWQDSGGEETLALARQYMEKGFPPDFFGYGSRANELAKLLTALLRTDVEFASEFWHAAEQASTRSGQSYGTSSSNGFVRQRSSRMLESLLSSNQMRNQTLPLPVWADFLGRLERQQPGSVSALLSDMSYYIREITNRWLQENTQTWEKDPAFAKLEAANRTRAGAFLELAADCPPHARGIAASLLAGSDSFRHGYGNTKTLVQIADWLLAPERAEHAWLARPLALSLRSAWSGDEETRKQRYFEIATAFMADEEIPPAIRLGLLANLIGHNDQFLQGMDESVAARLADILRHCISDGSAVWYDSSFRNLLSRLASHTKLPAEAATSLREAIAAHPPEMNEPSAQDFLAGLQLHLAVQAGEKTEILRLARLAPSQRGNTETLLRLWQSDHTEAARLLMPRPGEYFSHRSNNARFTRAIEDAMPAWLASLPDAGQRFRFECLLSSLLDAEENQAPARKRPERITALVGRFPAEAPSVKHSRLECLHLLAHEPIHAKPLAAEFHQATERRTLGEIAILRAEASSDSPLLAETRILEQLIRHSLRFRLEEGEDLQPAADQFLSLLPIPGGNQEYQARNMLGEISPWFAALALRRMVEIPPAARPAAAEASRQWAAHLLAHGESQSHRLAVALAIAAHAAAGEGDKLDPWLASLPESSRSRYEQTRKNQGLGNCFSILRLWPLSDKSFTESRRALLTALLSDPATLQRDLTHNRELNQLLESNFFNLEDMDSTILALPEDHPRRAEFLTERAGMIAWRNNFETGLAAYELAEQAAAESSPAAVAFCRAYRLMWLGTRAGKKDLARELLPTIDISLLPDAEKTIVENTRKELDK